MGSLARRRIFQPLGPPQSGHGAAGKLVGIVFDVDGTLCEPQNYMFGEMRAALGISKPTDILDHIYSLPLGESEVAMEKVRQIERTAMEKQTPQPGLLRLMDYLDSRNIRKGICTRNFEAPVTHLLTTFLPSHKFEPIITRDFRPPKPDPAGILHIAGVWGLGSSTIEASQDSKAAEAINNVGLYAKPVEMLPIIMVGDSIDDIIAGYRAGAATVLLKSDANTDIVEHPFTDLSIDRLDELIDVLERGFEGKERSDESRR